MSWSEDQVSWVLCEANTQLQFVKNNFKVVLLNQDFQRIMLVQNSLCELKKESFTFRWISSPHSTIADFEPPNFNKN